MTTTLDNQISTMQNDAEKIKNDEPRRFDAWAPGDVAAQGDLNLVCISALPKSAKTRSNRQMAEGATQGSRHIVEGGECFDADPAEVAGLIKEATGKDIDPRYIGPVFSGPCTLTHPEHGNHDYPACTNAVVYQRVLDAEEREQRAQD